MQLEPVTIEPSVTLAEAQQFWEDDPYRRAIIIDGDNKEFTLWCYINGDWEELFLSKF